MANLSINLHTPMGNNQFLCNYCAKACLSNNSANYSFIRLSEQWHRRVIQVSNDNNTFQTSLFSFEGPMFSNPLLNHNKHY